MNIRYVPKQLRPFGPWAAFYKTDVPMVRPVGALINVGPHKVSVSAGVRNAAGFVVGWHTKRELPFPERQWRTDPRPATT